MEQEDQVDHTQRHLIQPIVKAPHLMMPSQELTQTFDFPSTISSDGAPSMSLIEVDNSIKNDSSTRNVSDRNTDQRKEKVFNEETLVKQDVLLDPQSDTYFFIKLTTSRILLNDAQTYPLCETTVRFNQSSFTLQNEYSELTLVVRSKEHKLEWLAAFQKVTSPTVDHQTEKQNIINKKRFDISQMKKLAKQPRQRSIKGAVFIVYETLTIVLLNVFRIIYAVRYNFFCEPCLWDTGPIWQLNNWGVVWTIISTLLICTEALSTFYFCRVKDPFKCALYIQTLQLVMVLAQLAWCAFGLILAFNQFGFDGVANINYKVCVLVVIAIDCTVNIVNAIVGYIYIHKFQVELARKKAALMLETDRLQYELTGVEYNLTYSKTAGKCYVCGRLYDKEQVVEAACKKHNFMVVCHFTCLRELGAVECPN